MRTILNEFFERIPIGRILNRYWAKPKSGTWWTKSGSKRKLPNEHAVLAAVRYVKEQPNPLVIWIAQCIEK